MSHPRIMAAIMAEPWAITEGGLQQILAIATAGHGDMEALATKRAHRLEDTRRAGIRDGVAVLEVAGPIFRRANMMTEHSGATSLQGLAQDFQAAKENPSVRGVLLDVETPGGQVAGIAEFAAIIEEMRGVKPVWVYVGSLGASAGYWLASAASRIVVAKTAQLGSIGIVSTVRTGRDPEAIEIVSSQSPRKRPDVATEEGRALVQAQTDQLADMFIADVARARGKTPEQVANEFGRGGMLLGPAAVAAGMADALGSFESTLADLARATRGTSRTSSRRALMSEGQQGGADNAASFTQADLDAAIARTKAEMQAAHSVALDTARKEAVTAEAKRRDEIQALAQPGFDAELKAALEGGHSPEQFAMAVMKASRDRGITLAAIRKDAPPAAPHAKPADYQPVGAAQSWEQVGAVTRPRM